MIVLIRHGDKAWANGKKFKYSKGFSHDPPLSLSATDKLQITRQKLLDQKLSPDIIIVSPFLRCRQTADILSEGEFPIVIDSEWREYLGNWGKRQKQVKISPITQDHIGKECKLIENYNQFTIRVKNLLHKEYDDNSTIWIVTHGIIISLLQKFKNNQSIEVTPGDYIILDI